MERQLKSAAAWFEIPCADLDRAQRFYETILGCRMKKDRVDAGCVVGASQGLPQDVRVLGRAFVQKKGQTLEDYLRQVTKQSPNGALLQGA